MVKVGLLIKKPDSIFSNGCVQQPLFLKRTLESAGCEVLFIGIESDYTVFEQTQESILYTTSQTDFASFDVVILASVVLLENENNLPYIQNLQKYDLFIVNFICGNIFILHQEEFVFNKHNIMHHYMQSYYHLNWIMEMYDYCEDYLRIMSNKETKVVPYLWDPDIVQNYVSKNNLLGSLGTDRSKINIMIFEANMSIHKNSLVPLLICEEFYRKYPDRLNKVYVFCCEKLLQQNSHMVGWLSIFKEKRVEVYGRIVMPYIVDVISKNNDYLSVMLSFTLMNRLNFIHLEMMHLGIPIVHNCKPFELEGNYYEDHDLRSAARALENVRTTFVDRSHYKARSADILRRYSASNPERVSAYKDLIAHIMTRRPGRAPVAPAPLAPTPPQRGVFKTGSGTQMIVTDSRTLGLSRALMRDWTSAGLRKNLEIAYTSNIDDVLIKEIKNDIFHHVHTIQIALSEGEDLQRSAEEQSRFVQREGVSWKVYQNTGDCRRCIIRS